MPVSTCVISTLLFMSTLKACWVKHKCMMISMVNVLWFFTKYKSAEFKKKKSRRKGFTVMPFTVSRLQSHTFISKTTKMRSLYLIKTNHLGIQNTLALYTSCLVFKLQPHTRTVSLCNCLANNG